MTDDPAKSAGTEDADPVRPEHEAAAEALAARFRDVRARVRGLRSGMSLSEVESEIVSVREEVLDKVRQHGSDGGEGEEAGPGGPLDLDRVRARIGRRLDRIRAAREAG